MGIADDAMGLVVAAVIAVVGLYVVAVMITSLAQSSPLFSNIMFGGGVLAAIIGAFVLLFKRS
jgi:uncharacterized membrane protein